MKNIRMACIGVGNMGTALLRGLVGSKALPPGRIIASDLVVRRLKRVEKELQVNTTSDNIEAVQRANLVVLAVEPQKLAKVLTGLKGKIQKDALILSMAAGFPTTTIEKLLNGRPRVVRAMPNIAATVGMAATAICPGSHARKSELKLARQVFESCGIVVEVEENLMNAVTGLSGTGPMYVFIIIEALSDAGVRVGLGRDESMKLSIQTVLGSARMVEETGQHPIFLKDLVTSPGGTAINALYSMEKTGLRAVLMDAVEAATRRSRELGQPFNKQQD